MYLIERLSKMHSLNIGKSKLQIWLTLFLASSLIGLFSQHVFGLESQYLLKRNLNIKLL